MATGGEAVPVLQDHGQRELEPYLPLRSCGDGIDRVTLEGEGRRLMCWPPSLSGSVSLPRRLLLENESRPMARSFRGPRGPPVGRSGGPQVVIQVSFSDMGVCSSRSHGAKGFSASKSWRSDLLVLYSHQSFDDDTFDEWVASAAG